MEGVNRAAWIEEPSAEFQAANPGWNEKEAPQDRLILRPSAPLPSAREYRRRRHVFDGTYTLHHQNGTFYAWAQTHYLELKDEEIKASLYAFLDTAEQPGKKEGETIPFNPNKSKVANVIEALAAEAQLSVGKKAPCWLDENEHPDANDLVTCTNGLLSLPTRRLLPHSPLFFSLNALEFPYDPAAAQPAVWLKFLEEIWPDDPQSIEMLQEAFGLLLTGDTSHQKAFLIVGPKRSGKGTIARVITALLGRENVAGPTLSSLGQNFGLAPLIGKRLAIISDARLGGKADQQMVVERILSITGEDTLSIDRKFLSSWTGRLQTRFVVMTNELPRLADASGALASRFLILLMTRSFYGREDQTLTDKLLQELPGILNWSLDGWARLKARKRFVQPQSAAEAQRDFEDLGSPMGAFVRDCCDVGAGFECRPEELYSRWLSWCNDQNIARPGTVQTFGRDIRSVVSSIRKVQHRNAVGVPERFYGGVGLKK